MIRCSKILSNGSNYLTQGQNFVKSNSFLVLRSEALLRRVVYEKCPSVAFGNEGVGLVLRRVVLAPLLSCESKKGGV